MNRNLAFILITLSLTIASCKSPRFVHSPVAVNNPFFTKRNDSKLGAYISGGSHSGDASQDSNKVRGADVMGAYAITDHIAVTGSYHYRNERNYYLSYRFSPFDTSKVNYKRRMWELGIGYFTALNKSGTITANIYVGAGSATYNIKDEGTTGNAKYTRYHDSKPFKFYFQPGVNFITGSVRIGTTLRLNILTYKNVTTNYSNEELVSFQLDELNNKTLLFPEFVLTTAYRFPKYPWIGLEGQVSLNFNDDRYYRSRTMNASAGLILEPFKLLSRKKATE